MKYLVEVDFLCGNKFVDEVELSEKELANLYNCFNKKKNFYLEGTKTTILVGSEYVTNLKLKVIKEEE